MAPDQALRQFAQSIAIYRDPIEIGAALHVLTANVIGVRLFTLTAINVKAGHVRRVYSSHLDIYPLLGTKPLERDAWFDQMQNQGTISAINRAEDMEGNFTDLDLIRSIGCNASISIPARAGGKLLGTINALDVEGQYTPERVEAAQALLVPAVAAFLLLSQHFVA